MPRTNICPHCGTHNAEDDLFCVHCGKKISRPSTGTQTYNKGVRKVNIGKVVSIVMAIIVFAFLVVYGVYLADTYGYFEKNGKNGTFSVSSIANDGMLDVLQYLNGFDIAVPAMPMNGELPRPYYNFEKHFSAGSYDYNVIRIFSDYRNDILEATFSNERREKVRSKVMDYYSWIGNFIYLDKTLHFQNYDVIVDYSELSDQGKRTFLELAKAILLIYLPGYESIGDGDKVIFDIDDLNRDVRSKLDALVY